MKYIWPRVVRRSWIKLGGFINKVILFIISNDQTNMRYKVVKVWQNINGPVRCTIGDMRYIPLWQTTWVHPKKNDSLSWGVIYVPRDLGLIHPFSASVGWYQKKCGVKFHFKELEAKLLNPVFFPDLLLESCRLIEYRNTWRHTRRH